MGNGEVQKTGLPLFERAAQLRDWWLGELIQLIPRRLRRLYAARPCHLVLHFDADGVKVYKEAQKLRKSSPSLRLQHDGQWSTALTFLGGYSRRWGRLLSLGLRLPVEQCLIRDKELPVAALRRAGEILLLDMERISPFARDDILSDWYQDQPPGEQSTMVRLTQVIVKRSLIDGYIADIKAAGLSLQAVDVYDQTGRVLPVNLLSQLPQQPRQISRTLSRAISLAAAAVIFLVTGIAVSAVYRQERALSQLTQQTATVRRQAVAIKTKLAMADQAEKQITGHRLRWIYRPTVLQIWEEVTRLLPDSAWVASFRINDNQLYLDGFAASASELIGMLGRSKYLSNVTFTSPVVADFQQRQERFQIRAKILQPGQRKDNADKHKIRLSIQESSPQ